jgi:pSer/pThr/pTyr-binding forkhead associated (FHA) protein
VTAVLFLLRAIILVLLWGFVVAAIVAVRHDVFGTRPGRTPPAPKPARASTPRSQRPDKADKSAARKLVVTEGELAGTSVTLTTAAVTIGRAADSTVVLSDDYVSTKHARLVPAEGQWLLEDLGSTNGTYLDRRRVTAPTPVPIGTPIRVGKTVMELRK